MNRTHWTNTDYCMELFTSYMNVHERLLIITWKEIRYFREEKQLPFKHQSSLTIQESQENHGKRRPVIEQLLRVPIDKEGTWACNIPGGGSVLLLTCLVQDRNLGTWVCSALNHREFWISSSSNSPEDYNCAGEKDMYHNMKNWIQKLIPSKVTTLEN